MGDDRTPGEGGTRDAGAFFFVALAVDLVATGFGLLALAVDLFVLVVRGFASSLDAAVVVFLAARAKDRRVATISDKAGLCADSKEKECAVGRQCRRNAGSHKDDRRQSMNANEIALPCRWLWKNQSIKRCNTPSSRKRNHRKTMARMSESEGKCERKLAEGSHLVVTCVSASQAGGSSHYYS